MKIHISFDEQYAKNSEIFLSSIQDTDIELVSNKILLNNPSTGFRSKSWYDCVRSKIEFYAEQFSNLSNEEILVTSDLDVYYFKPEQLVKTYTNFIDSSLDFIGMSEQFKCSDEINTGLFFIKKNKRTKNFFNKILKFDFSQFKLGDQDALNIVLQRSNINWSTLDPKTYVMGCFFHLLQTDEYENIVAVHTTCTSNIKEKVEQINLIKNKMSSDYLWWDHSYG